MNTRRIDHRLLLAAGLAAAALLATSPAWADDGGIANVGGAVRLLQDQGNVRMVSERSVGFSWWPPSAREAWRKAVGDVE